MEASVYQKWQSEKQFLGNLIFGRRVGDNCYNKDHTDTARRRTRAMTFLHPSVMMSLSKYLVSGGRDFWGAQPSAQFSLAGEVAEFIPSLWTRGIMICL